MRPLKARKNEYTFCDLESNVPKNAGLLLMTGNHENAPVLFQLLATRQLYKKLWEIKISQERIMYVIRDQESVFFLNICKKQKGKAEKQELERAKKRAKAAGLL